MSVQALNIGVKAGFTEGPSDGHFVGGTQGAISRGVNIKRYVRVEEIEKKSPEAARGAQVVIECYAESDDERYNTTQIMVTVDDCEDYLDMFSGGVGDEGEVKAVKALVKIMKANKCDVLVISQ